MEKRYRRRQKLVNRTFADSDVQLSPQTSVFAERLKKPLKLTGKSIGSPENRETHRDSDKLTAKSIRTPENQ